MQTSDKKLHWECNPGSAAGAGCEPLRTAGAAGGGRPQPGARAPARCLACARINQGSSKKCEPRCTCLPAGAHKKKIFRMQPLTCSAINRVSCSRSERLLTIWGRLQLGDDPRPNSGGGPTRIGRSLPPVPPMPRPLRGHQRIRRRSVGRPLRAHPPRLRMEPLPRV